MDDDLPDVQTLVRRGHSYSRREEYAKAIAAFTGAIDLDPADDEKLKFQYFPEQPPATPPPAKRPERA